MAAFTWFRSQRHSSKNHSLTQQPRASARMKLLDLEWLEDRTVPANILVTNTLNSGAGSLAQAIVDANLNPGQDTIVFNIPGGAQTIVQNTALPAITDPLIIDATTQPGQGSQPLVAFQFGGSLTADAETELRGSFRLNSSGTITGASTISINGTLSWIGGTLSGTGSLAILPGSIVNFNGISTLDKPVVNQGTATWTSQVINAGSSGSWTNASGSMFNANAKGWTFSAPFVNQSGANFVCNSDSGGAVFSNVFINDGNVNIVAGTLKLTGGGTSNGVFQGSGTGTLQLNGHTLTSSSSVTVSNVSFGNGTTEINGLYQVANSSSTVIAEYGTVNFNPVANVVSVGQTLTVRGGTNQGLWNFNSGETITVSTLNIPGGNLSGADTIVIAPGGTFSWAGGILGGTGSIILSPGSTGTLQPTGQNQFNRTLENYGSVAMTGVQIPGTGTWINHSGAVFDIQMNSNFRSFSPNIVNQSGALINVGFTNNTYQFSMSGSLDNQGTLQVNGGYLEHQSGPITQYVSGTLTAGTWKVIGGGSLRLNGSSQIHTLNAELVLDGPGSSILTASSASNLQNSLNTINTNGSLSVINGNQFTAIAGFTNAGTLTVGTGSSFTKTGTYSQSAASTNTIVNGTLTATSVSLSNGVLQGTGTLVGNVTNSGGVIRPGSSPGILTINGDFTQTTGGTLEVEIGGTAGSAFDQLQISGTATLNGTLNVSLVNGFVPVDGNSFQILNFSSRIGDFSNYTATSPQLSNALNATNLTLFIPSLVNFDSAEFFGASGDNQIFAKGDVNGDGILDIVANGYSSIRVFRGNGDGSFTQTGTFPTNGTGTVGLVMGQFDNNNTLDVAVTNYNNDNVNIFLGDGHGNFSLAQSYAVGDYPYSLAIGDLNQDNTNDLVIGNYYSSSVTVLRGLGDGAFQNVQTIGTGTGTQVVVVADYDGDQRIDVACANWSSNTISVYRTQSNGSLLLHSTIACGTNPIGITAADFDRDGDNDLVVSHRGNSSVFYYQNNAGNFTHTNSFSVGLNQAMVQNADVNADGLLDLLVANQFSSQVSVLIGKGDGTFNISQVFAVSSVPYMVDAADFDGNGSLDLLASGSSFAFLRNLANSANPNLTINVPATATVGTPFQVTVTARDSNGNVNTGFTGTVHFASSDRFANLPADYTFTAADQGVKTFTVVPETGGSQTVSAAIVGSNGIVAGGVLNVNLAAVVFGVPATRADTGPSYSIGHGDFNEDGILDLVSGNYGTSSLNLFLGNGNGTYRDPVTYVVGGSPSSVEVGDIDGDGHLDLACGTYSGHTLVLLFGRGDGTFGDLRSWSHSYDPVDVKLADMNGDGRKDLVAANYWNPGGSVTVLLQNGTRTFQSPLNFASGSGANGITVADFDSDGDQDVATADYQAGTMSVLLNNGSGVLTAPAAYVSGSIPVWIVSGDFNRDGVVDLAVTNYSSNDVSLFRGNGNGTFQQAIRYSLGSNTHDLSATDLNNDGLLDLAISLPSVDQIGVLLGRGDGTFASVITFPSGDAPYGITNADFDGNGTIDLSSSNYQGNSISVLLNLAAPANPHLTINVPATVTIGVPFQVTVTARDSSGNVYTGFTGTVHFASSDRFADLPADYTFTAADQGVKSFTVVPHSGGSQTVSAALVGSNGIVAGKTVNVTLTPASLGNLTSYPTVASTYGITTGDFNRDGILDLLTSGNTGSADIFRGNGDGTFSKTSSVTTGGRSVEAVSADLNNDGKIDVITADASSNAVSVLLGDGDGGFARTTISTGLWPTSVAVGKLNNDAFLDIVTTNFDAGTISILYGNGNGTFQPHVQRTVSTRNGGVTIADFNGDGFDDIVTAEALNNYVSVMLGNGTGTFPTQVNYSTGSYTWRIETTDFNQDGKKDLAVACYSANRIDLLRGNGDGTFTSAGSVPTGSGPIDVKTTDLNGDGLQDMVVSLEAGASWQTILGRGDGTFDAPVTYAASSGPRELAVGDFDGNGTVDVAGAAYLANRLDVRLNAGSPANPHLAISVPAQVLVGTPTQVTVTARDSSGNINTGFTGTVHFASSDRFANLPADYTFTAADQGVKTFTINLHSNTEQTLSASLVSNSSIVSGKLIMVNTRPVANIGGTYSVSEGGAVTLDASASNDVDPGQALTLSYTWDLDGDGILGETGVNALHGDETGQYAVFSAASLSGPMTQPITLRVTDSWGSWDEATGVVTITDVDAIDTPVPDADGVFQVTVSAWSDGAYHDVTADDQGILRFVWDDRYVAPTYNDVFLSQFDANGNVQFYESLVNSNRVTDDQRYPRIATNGAGRSVVTWQSWGEDVNGWATVGRIIDSNGSPISGHFLINQYGGGWEVHPSVAMRADGSFLAAYRGDGRDGSSGSIMASFFDMYGNRVGDEFLVNQHFAGDQYKPLITLTPSGDFMVAWTSSSQDAGTSGIYARRVNASGVVGSEFRINVLSQGDQYLGDLVTLTDGTVVATYYGNPDASSGYDVFVRRFTPEGQPLSGELRVNSYTTDWQDACDIIATEDGGFVVAWQSLGQDGSSYGIYAQRYDAAGVALGNEFLVNSVTAGAQSYPHLAAHDNLLTVSWLTWTEFGGYGGVVARQFHLDEANAPPTADAGGPYSVLEGEGLTLDATASSDPENDSLTYTWDINGDGIFTDATSCSPTLNWATLNSLGIVDGPASIINLRVRVDDNHGNVVTSSSVSLTVINSNPTASISGPGMLVRNQPGSFVMGATDPSSVDQAAPMTFEVDWDGNGVFEDSYVVVAGSTVAHSYTNNGTYQVRMRTTDKDGGTSEVVTHTVTVNSIIPPSNGGDLIVGGTDGDDIFTFTPGTNPGDVIYKLNGVTQGTFNVTGKIHAFGGAGTDQVIVNGTSLVNVFSLDQDKVVLNSMEHLGYQVEQWTINALGSGDTITVYGGTATVNGGSGSDRLISALPTNNHWYITSQNAGNLNGVIFFTSVEHLTGGDYRDWFHFADGYGVSGQIAGGADQDEVDYSAFSTAVSVNLNTGAATKTGGTASIESVVGGSATDTLTGPNLVNGWTLSSPNAGDINSTYYFSAIENLTGGNQADTFHFTSGAQVGGNISGNGGEDVFNFPLGEDITVNLELDTATRLAGVFSSIDVIQFGFGSNDTIIGDNNTNNWTLTAAGTCTVDGIIIQYVENLVGGAGTDTVIGLAQNNDWTLTGPNAGTLLSLYWTGMENITGGNQADTFLVGPGASLTGTLSGGTGVDTIDYSTFASPVTMNLAALSSTGINRFTSITNILGSNGHDLLIGGNGTSTWNIATSDSGTVGGFTFTSLESFQGGDGNDTFKVAEGVLVNSVLNGGNGIDKLDFTTYTTSANVNLTAGTATGTLGIAGFENVTGGAGNDMIYGDAADNTLIGGSGNDVIFGFAGNDTINGGAGRDLLVGGSGSDTITGGGDEDILIAALLQFASESTGLVDAAKVDSIMAEWTRTDLAYAARIANLSGQGSGGQNGNVYLDSSTVVNDGVANVLEGGSGLDWFLGSLLDQVNKTSSETLTVI